MGDNADPELESTWARRELPVLRCALRLIDEGVRAPAVEDIRREVGLDENQMRVALRALASASPPYLVMHELMDGDPWQIKDVGERARRELGTWPSANSIVDKLVASLREAQDREADPDRRSKLATAASVIGDTARQIVVSVISAKLSGL